MRKLRLLGGKYAAVLNDGGHLNHFERNGKRWPAGDCPAAHNVVIAMAKRIAELEDINLDLVRQLEGKGI